MKISASDRAALSAAQQCVNDLLVRVEALRKGNAEIAETLSRLEAKVMALKRQRSKAPVHAAPSSTEASVACGAETA